MCLCSSLLAQLCRADPHQRGVILVPPAGTCTGASSLISAGIPFSQQHMTRMEKKMVHYLLLSAPWSVLCYYAEELQLRVPLQVKGCGAQAPQGWETVPPALPGTPLWMTGWAAACCGSLMGFAASLLSGGPSSSQSPVLSHARLWDPTSVPF